MEYTHQIIKKELLQKGIRPSAQRVQILAFLHRVEIHPTAEDIFRQLSGELPSLSRATTYNTLNTLAKAGLVRVISIDGVEKRYDAALHNHGHFICESCSAIINFKIDLDAFPAEDLKQYRITSKNVFFNGLCPRCLIQTSTHKE